jgi:hypothetical protein
MGPRDGELVKRWEMKMEMGDGRWGDPKHHEMVFGLGWKSWNMRPIEREKYRSELVIKS